MRPVGRIHPSAAALVCTSTTVNGATRQFNGYAADPVRVSAMYRNSSAWGELTGATRGWGTLAHRVDRTHATRLRPRGDACGYKRNAWPNDRARITEAAAASAFSM